MKTRVLAGILILLAMIVPAASAQTADSAFTAAAATGAMPDAAPAAQDGACPPLTAEEQTTLERLDRLNQTGELDGAGWDQLRGLYDKASCSPQPAAAAAAAAAASPDAAVTFAVVTDYGTATATEATVATMIKNTCNPAFIVTGGDNYQGSSNADVYPTNVGNYYGPGAGTDWITSGNFYPVPGNHDYYSGGGNLNRWYGYFNSFSYISFVEPYNGTTNAMYYQFERAPVHFFMLDTGNTDDVTPDATSQQTWLSTQLAASTAPWNIVMFHMPAASGGASHGSDTGIQWDFAGMGADFVIGGHNHVYERIAWNGITYFTAGAGGGNARTDWSASYLPSGAVAQAVYGETGDTLSGFMCVTASDTSINFEYITTDGTVQDSATYTAEPEQSCTTVSFQQGTNSYAGALDTYIRQADPTYNYGITSPVLMDTDEPYGTSNDASTLLYWDISSIPAGSTIQSASVTVYVENATNSDTPGYDLYDMTQAWTEGSGNGSATGDGATWNTYDGTNTWPGGAGGNNARNSTSLANFAPRTASTTYTANLNASGLNVLKSWVDAPANNKGFMIAAGTEDDGVDITSSEGATANRPKLTIEYCTPAAVTIQKAVDLATASPGETLSYTISGIGYDGSSLLSSVTVADAIPAGATYVADSDTPEATEGSGTLTWNLGSNAAGTPGSASGTSTITVDSTSTPGTTSGGTSITFSHTTGASADRLMLVGVSWSRSSSGLTGRTISSVYWGTTELTPAVGTSYNDQYRRVAIYYLLAPAASTTANVVVTFSSNVDAVASAATFAGVNQAAPSGFTGAVGDSGSPTVNVTTAVNDLVFATVVDDQNSSLSLTGTGQTSIWNVTSGTGTYDVRGAASTELATTTSTTMSWTASGGTNNDWAIGAVPIKPASSSRTTTLSAYNLLVSGGDTVTLDATFTNTAANNNVTPGSVTTTPAGGASCSSWTGPTLVSTDNDITGSGDPVTYRWTCTATGGTTLPSSLTFSVAATGDGSVSYPSGASNSVLVVPPLTFQVTINDPASVTQVDNHATLDDSGSYITAKDSNTASTVLAGRIGNSVWSDTDGDGVRDGGESGINGVVVQLYKDDGLGGLGPLAYQWVADATTATYEGSAGFYQFRALPAGQYQVRLADSNFASGGALYGLIQTTNPVGGGNQSLPYDVNLPAATTHFAGDFGFARADLGDLPDGSYATYVASNGPRHIVFPDANSDGKPETWNSVPAVWLGQIVDTEGNGQPSGDARGDDSTASGSDDEDGVMLTQLNNVGGKVRVSVTDSDSAANYSACLNAWMDFTNDSGSGAGQSYADGNFTLTGNPSAYDSYGGYSEHIINNQTLTTDGVAVNVPFNVPSNLNPPDNSGLIYYYNFRFRLTPGACSSAIAPTGLLVNGEIEDYRWGLTPLAVDLASFSAEATDAGVTLAWETVSEVDNAGFNVYRATGGSVGDRPQQEWVKLNDVLIPAATPGSAQGNAYTWTDMTPATGTTWYMLEDVALDGTATQHEPVSVTVAEPNSVGMTTFGAAGTALPALAGLGMLALAVVALSAIAGVRLRKRR